MRTSFAKLAQAFVAGVDQAAAAVEDRAARGRQIKAAAWSSSASAACGKGRLGAGLGAAHRAPAGCPSARRPAPGPGGPGWPGGWRRRTVSAISSALRTCVPFGDRARNAERIAFLEGVRADQGRGHLSADAQDRHRVAQGVEQAGGGVGHARSRGHEHHAQAAGRARIAFGGMHRGLLVPYQHMAQARLAGTRRRTAGAPRRRDSRRQYRHRRRSGPAQQQLRPGRCLQGSHFMRAGYPQILSAHPLKVLHNFNSLRLIY
jgi:hypothetical protein